MESVTSWRKWRRGAGQAGETGVGLAVYAGRDVKGSGDWEGLLHAHLHTTPYTHAAHSTHHTGFEYTTRTRTLAYTALENRRLYTAEIHRQQKEEEEEDEADDAGSPKERRQAVFFARYCRSLARGIPSWMLLNARFKHVLAPHEYLFADAEKLLASLENAEASLLSDTTERQPSRTLHDYMLSVKAGFCCRVTVIWSLWSLLTLNSTLSPTFNFLLCTQPWPESEKRGQQWLNQKTSTNFLIPRARRSHAISMPEYWRNDSPFWSINSVRDLC
ncbi:hypothetical protein DFH27DRAFT_613112 [Peziza echinospora]|nr:hypothetical protein DFH27DRAFT_613112 [Peziza echinospora]